MIIGIGAIDLAGGIGFNNDLPWPRLRHDMKRFKALTMNEIVIMGRKTWQSLGNKPLKERLNIVVTSNPAKLQSEFIVDHYDNENENENEKTKVMFIQYEELDSYVDLCLQSKAEADRTIYVIGGATLWKAFEKLYDLFYITRIIGLFHTDVRMDVKSLKRELPCVLYTSSVKREAYPYYYETWGRRDVV